MKGRTIKTNCINCNTQFDVEIKEINRGNGKFCKRSCFQEWRKNNYIGKDANVTCAQCGKEFYKNKSKQSLSKSGLFFCCRKCKDTAQRIGGIEEIQPDHYNDGSSSYRTIAFREREKSCEVCGYDTHPAILQVHHIDRDRTNNSIDNLIILCPTCHFEEHYNNRDGQFWKYLK
jgi:hypothetical protein